MLDFKINADAYKPKDDDFFSRCIMPFIMDHPQLSKKIIEGQKMSMGEMMEIDRFEKRSVDNRAVVELHYAASKNQDGSTTRQSAIEFLKGHAHTLLSNDSIAAYLDFKRSTLEFLSRNIPMSKKIGINFELVERGFNERLAKFFEQNPNLSDYGSQKPDGP